jgi:hypothetical protein
MSFFKKLFNSPKPKEAESQVDLDSNDLCLDQIFVKNFIAKNGKFLYCATIEDVKSNLSKILAENDWNEIICNDIDLIKLLDSKTITIKNKFTKEIPLFVGCEHLIAENGSILFSSNQLKDYKIFELSDHFIVYATTSQLVKTKSESLTGINSRFKGNIPSNISAIKNYNPNSDTNDFMNYGNTNSKNLYLLLFEDL